MKKELIKVIAEEIAYQNENGFSSLEIKGLEYALKLIRMEPKINEWNTIYYNKEDGYLYNLPEHNEEVLVAHNGHVSADTFIDDGTDGVYFDSGMDVEEGMRWMSKPKPPEEDEE